MHAVTTWELGKSDKKIKIKLLDPPPPLSEFPVQGIGGGRGGCWFIDVTSLKKDLF